jgi:pyrrolidone-carboxylate peptidase
MDAFRLLAVVRALGIPAECSSDAGRFLCNEVMFHVLERRARHGAPACARSSAASQGCACAMQK